MQWVDTPKRAAPTSRTPTAEGAGAGSGAAPAAQGGGDGDEDGGEDQFFGDDGQVRTHARATRRRCLIMTVHSPFCISCHTVRHAFVDVWC